MKVNDKNMQENLPFAEKDATLVLVDDEEMVLNSLRSFIELETDYNIESFTSPGAALEYAAEGPLDVIVSDFLMPDMNGLELADRIAEVSENNIPIIIMTGFPSLESAIEALRKRVYDYFVKPFNINRVYSTVEKAIADANGNQTTLEQ